MVYHFTFITFKLLFNNLKISATYMECLTLYLIIDIAEFKPNKLFFLMFNVFISPSFD